MDRAEHIGFSELALAIDELTYEISIPVSFMFTNYRLLFPLAAV